MLLGEGGRLEGRRFGRAIAQMDRSTLRYANASALRRVLLFLLASV